MEEYCDEQHTHLVPGEILYEALANDQRERERAANLSKAVSGSDAEWLR